MSQESQASKWFRHFQQAGEPDSKGLFFLKVEKTFERCAFNQLYWKPLLPVTQALALEP